MRYKTCVAAVAFAILPLAAMAQSATPPADPAAKSELREKVRTACGPDVQKFCANIEKAKGAMRSCLEANEKALSDPCKAARAERAAARGKT